MHKLKDFCVHIKDFSTGLTLNLTFDVNTKRTFEKMLTNTKDNLDFFVL